MLISLCLAGKKQGVDAYSGAAATADLRIVKRPVYSKNNYRSNEISD